MGMGFGNYLGTNPSCTLEYDFVQITYKPYTSASYM